MPSKLNIFRYIHSSVSKSEKDIPKLKGRKTSSQKWLLRQLNDPYIEKTKLLNYRCRSAFKLIEINERYNILKPGQTVVDCGAAPGSWTQYAIKETNSLGHNSDMKMGLVIALDKQSFYPIEGATILANRDLTTENAVKDLKEILGEKRVDIFLSDMAPNATGVRQLDNENMIHLCYSVLRLAVQLSSRGAMILIKLWQCNERINLENAISKFYRTVKLVKPAASRSDSAEIFLLGRQFKGLK